MSFESKNLMSSSNVLDAYLGKLAVILQVPDTCKLDQAERKDFVDLNNDPATSPTKVLAFFVPNASPLVAVADKSPTPAKSTTQQPQESVQTLHHLRLSKNQIELMRRVFSKMHTEDLESLLSCCANKACVPRSLLEMSIEQSFGLQ